MQRRGKVCTIPARIGNSSEGGIARRGKVDAIAILDYAGSRVSTHTFILLIGYLCKQGVYGCFGGVLPLGGKDGVTS